MTVVSSPRAVQNSRRVASGASFSRFSRSICANAESFGARVFIVAIVWDSIRSALEGAQQGGRRSRVAPVELAVRPHRAGNAGVDDRADTQGWHNSHLSGSVRV